MIHDTFPFDPFILAANDPSKDRTAGQNGYVQVQNSAPIIGVPPNPVPRELPAYMDIGPGSIITAILSVAAGLLYLRKKFFTDGADITKSQVEASLVKTLSDQAEMYKKDARDAWDRRTSDAELIARQAAQLDNLRRTLRIMHSTLRDVAPDKARMFEGIDAYSDPPTLTPP